MNRNLRMTIWVLALGIAFTGFSTPGLAAAVPAQQDRDHDRNRDGDRDGNRNGDGGYFQQGLRDGQHDRRYGGNRSDHQQPRDSTDLRAYQDGYRQGFRNPSNGQYGQPNPWLLGRDNGSWFQQGLSDGQHDRQYGGNRSDHQQPGNSSDLTAYQNGYRQGFRNTWFQQGLSDGQHDRRYGGNRSDHQQPDNSSDLTAYQNGYRQGFRDTR